MFQFFDIVRSRFGAKPPPAPVPKGFAPKLSPVDADSFTGKSVVVGESVNGLTVIIDYRDAKGASSTRQISCIRIENGAGKRYLRAFCHQRRALRMFLVERIDAVIDAETGELLAAGDAFFRDYGDDRIGQTAPGWGLSVQKRADLGAGLTSLIFLSRCDGQMHPAEVDEVETFASAWWMRAEIRSPMPEADIFAHAKRLAPDVEAFVLAAHRVRSEPQLARLVAGYARRVIEEDGRLAPEELHWIERLIGWLNESA